MFQSLPDINLLPRYERKRSSGIVFPLLSLIVLLAAFSIVGFFYFKWNADLDRLTNEDKSLSDNITILTAKLTELNKVEVSEREESIAFIDGHDIPTSIFIEELYTLLPEHAYLSAYNYSTGQARIVSDFESLNYVAGYLSKLEHSDYIMDAKINNVSTFELKEDEENTLTEFEKYGRYQANFILDINGTNLKGAARNDE